MHSVELKKFEKILSLIPEGPKKESLMAKFKKVQRDRTATGGGLYDEYTLKPVGHISIEEIDEHGDVVGVLADQPNLVVDGAEEILLRAFSGDPSRILYKNRTLKDNESQVYHVALDSIFDVEGDANIITHHPNELWKEVDDEEFDIEYGYYPNTLYVKEEESTEPNKKAFRIVSKPTIATAPLTAEVYSTFTNLFIGLGDGVNYEVPLMDERLTYTGAFQGTAVRETTDVNAEIKFSEKISNFELLYSEHNKGGKIGVYIDDVLQETIDTLNADLEADQQEVRTKVLEGLSQDTETEVRIVFTEADSSVSDPKVIINGLRFDAFSKNMNGLIHEFENYTNEFLTPTAYNTTSTAPYTITLEHAPAKEGSVQIIYNKTQFEEVDALENVAEGKFYVDDLHGIVYFNRALTGLMVSYETTGQIMQDEKVSNLSTKEVLVSISGEHPTGNVNGINRTFALKHNNVTETLSVIVNEEERTAGSGSDQFSLNKANGTITFVTPPEDGATIEVSYIFKKNVNVLNTDFAINKNKDLILVDQEGKRFTLGDDVDAFALPGVFVVDTSDETNKTVLIDKEIAEGKNLQDLELYYFSEERPGVPTDYKRQVVLKPKDINQYPWYQLDKGSIRFVAEFEESVPNSSVTIREMGLFDGPRMDDQVKGFPGYPVKAFSLVRVGEARKDVSTGLRVTWTITLTNEEGLPFKGGL